MNIKQTIYDQLVQFTDSPSLPSTSSSPRQSRNLTKTVQWRANTASAQRATASQQGKFLRKKNWKDQISERELCQPGLFVLSILSGLFFIRKELRLKLIFTHVGTFHLSPGQFHLYSLYLLAGSEDLWRWWPHSGWSHSSEDCTSGWSPWLWGCWRPTSGKFSEIYDNISELEFPAKWHS